MSKIACAEFTNKELCAITGALYKAYTDYEKAGLGKEVVNEYKDLHEKFFAAWIQADDDGTMEPVPLF